MRSAQYWRAAFAVICLGWAVLGCSAMTQRNLQDSLFDYNRGIRWGLLGDVGAYLRPAARDSFVNRYSRLGDLKFTQYEIAQVQLKGAAQALVTVQFQWYREGQGRLYQTVVLQDWRSEGSTWFLSSQQWAGGAPLPVLIIPAMPP